MKINNKLILTLIFGFLVNINCKNNNDETFKLRKQPNCIGTNLENNNYDLFTKDYDSDGKEKNKSRFPEFFKIESDKIKFSNKNLYNFLINRFNDINIRHIDTGFFKGKKIFILNNETNEYDIEVKNPFDNLNETHEYDIKAKNPLKKFKLKKAPYYFSILNNVIYINLMENKSYDLCMKEENEKFCEESFLFFRGKNKILFPKGENYDRLINDLNDIYIEDIDIYLLKGKKILIFNNKTNRYDIEAENPFNNLNEIYQYYEAENPFV